MEVLVEIMAFKIIYLIHLLLYSMLVSQSFSYIIFLGDVQRQMSAQAYISFRQRTDFNFKRNFKSLTYALLGSNFLIACWMLGVGEYKFFIAALLSLLCLAADVLISLKRNLPINAIINSWTIDHYPEDWQYYRRRWFKFFGWRQLFNITGFFIMLYSIIFL